MAILTWRDVAGPSTGATQAAQLAANLFDRAGGQIAGAVAGFDKAQNAGANQQALLNMLQYGTQGAYEQALQTGQVTAGLDPKRLSTDTLGTLAGRAGDLQKLAYNQQRMDITGAEFDQQTADRAAAEAGKLPVNQLLQSATCDAGMAALAGMSPAEQLKYAGTLGTLKQTGLTNQQAVQDRARLEDVNRYVAQGVAMPNQDQIRVMLSGIADPVTRNAVQAELSKTFKGIYGPDAVVSPEGLSGMAGAPASVGSLGTADLRGTGAVPPGTAQGAGTQNGNSYDVVYGNGKFGLPAKPVSSMTLAEVMDFGETLKDNTRGTLPNQPKEYGTSAMGRYQFVGGTLKTLAPKVLGKDWQSQQFTPENQDKLAEALFNESKNGNLKKIWEGLPDTRPGAYKDVPWDQMKAIITKHESPTRGGAGLSPVPAQPAAASVVLRQPQAGALPLTGGIGAPAPSLLQGYSTPVPTPSISTPTNENASLQATLNDVRNGAGDILVRNLGAKASQRVMEQDPDGVGRVWQEFKDDRKTPAAVAAGLTGKDGALSGEDRSKVRDIIDEAAKKHGVPPALVGRYLENNTTSQGWLSFLNPLTTSTGKSQVKDSVLDEELKKFKDKKALAKAVAVNHTQDNVAEVTEAQKAYDTQAKRVESLVAMAQSTPSYRGVAESAQAELRKREAALVKLLHSTDQKLNK